MRPKLLQTQPKTLKTHKTTKNPPRNKLKQKQKAWISEILKILLHIPGKIQTQRQRIVQIFGLLYTSSPVELHGAKGWPSGGIFVFFFWFCGAFLWVNFAGFSEVYYGQAYVFCFWNPEAAASSCRESFWRICFNGVS